MVEFLLDTTDLEKVTEYLPILQISGLTSTPSIIKREGKIDFVPHMKKTLALLGEKRKLHVQLVGRNCQQLLYDARFVWDNISPQVYTKIPTTKEGLAAIANLRNSDPNCLITATAIYSKIQAFLAIDAKADYIAIYTDRSETIGVDPFEVMRVARTYIERTKSKTKIMASSIKNIQQLTKAIESGVDAITVSPAIVDKIFENATVKQAVDNFTEDWIELYEKEELI